jgi:hypothetical protein
LNQCFLIALDFESMFRAGMVKILLQQYRGHTGKHMLVLSFTGFDPTTDLGPANRLQNARDTR